MYSAPIRLMPPAGGGLVVYIHIVPTLQEQPDMATSHSFYHNTSLFAPPRE